MRLSQRIAMLLAFALSPAATMHAQSTDMTKIVAKEVAKIDAIAEAGPFKPQWSSLEQYQIPQWYKDAKLGIFIHWGVYSVPAYGSEWYPRNMYINKDGWQGNVFRHHKETWGDQSKFGYKDFIPMFKAEKFDPQSWVKLFKEAGAKYIVPVAEHHDGFPMYASTFTKWDASEMGPKRDLIAELEKAARAEGLKFGVSSHRAFNWLYFVRHKDFDNANPEFAGLYGRPMPFLFKEDAANYKEHWPPQDTEFKDEWLARTGELVDKFNPDLIWFDFGIGNEREKTGYENLYADHLKRFAAYYYNHAAMRGESAIINYKWSAFPEKAAVLDLERSKMDKIREPFWQTDTAVSKSSWGYTENQEYKQPGRLIDDLVDIVSKNGCLLLNVGPRSDGTIPDEDQAILREIGQWLKLNGEAIYETRYWITYGEGPTTTATGHLAENKDKPFTAEDIRFTTKGDSLYAILLDWPSGGEAIIKSLSSASPHHPGEIHSVSMLGSSSGLTFDRTEQGLVVKLPNEKPCDHAFVLKIR